jgi:hypothetical protein
MLEETEAMKKGGRLLQASISDRHAERLYGQYLENEREIAGQTLINCREEYRKQ